MKRLIYILLFVCITASGQIPGFNAGVVASQTVESEYSPELQAILDEMTPTPTGDTVEWMRVLVDSLKTYGGGINGYFGRTDFLYVHVLADPNVMWIDPDGSYTAVPSANVVHEIGEGHEGNGTDAWVDYNWDPSNDGSNWTQNSATLMAWCTEEISESASAVGQIGGAGENNIRPLYSSQFFIGRVNGQSSIFLSGQSTSIGLFSVSRTGATTIEAYRNGSSIGTDTDASEALDTYDFTGLRNGDTYYSGTIAIIMGLDGTTDSENAQLYRFFNTFMGHF